MIHKWEHILMEMSSHRKIAMLATAVLPSATLSGRQHSLYTQNNNKLFWGHNYVDMACT